MGGMSQLAMDADEGKAARDCERADALREFLSADHAPHQIHAIQPAPMRGASGSRCRGRFNGEPGHE